MGNIQSHCLWLSVEIPKYGIPSEGAQESHPTSWCLLHFGLLQFVFSLKMRSVFGMVDLKNDFVLVGGTELVTPEKPH